MKTIYSIVYYLLIGVLSWIIGVLLLSKFVCNGLALILGATAIAIAIILIAYCINIKKEPKKEKTVKITTDLQKLRDYMLYSSLSEKMNYLKSILNESDYKKSTNNKYLYYKKSIIYPIFNKEQIDSGDIIETISNYSDKYSNITIICIDYDKNSIELSKKLEKPITLINIKELYLKYILDKISIPNPPINQTPKNNFNWSYIKQTMLNENNWKKYLGFGFCLLIFGIFNRQRIYFVVFASLFWTLSIISLSKKLFRRSNQK